MEEMKDTQLHIAPTQTRIAPMVSVIAVPTPAMPADDGIRRDTKGYEGIRRDTTKGACSGSKQDKHRVCPGADERARTEASDALPTRERGRGADPSDACR